MINQHCISKCASIPCLASARKILAYTSIELTINSLAVCDRTARRRALRQRRSIAVASGSNKDEHLNYAYAAIKAPLNSKLFAELLVFETIRCYMRNKLRAVK